MTVPDQVLKTGAARVDLLIEQGGAWKPGFIYQEDGSPVDLTGYTARLQVRSAVNAATTVLDLTTENGGLAITPDQGLVSVFVAAATIAALEAPDPTALEPVLFGVYDLELIAPNGDPEPLAYGEVYFRAAVTR